MLVFIAWQSSKNLCDLSFAQNVSSRLQTTFSPLFSHQPKATVLRCGSGGVAFLELEVRDWKPTYSEKEKDRWALAPHYPIGIQRFLAHETQPHNQNQGLLIRLSETLDNDAARVVRELSPPFSLIWSDLVTGKISSQIDGLGAAQIFSYRGKEFSAITSHPFALKALGISLEPIAQEWALRFTLGWFPLDTTGFKGVQRLGPGARVEMENGAVWQYHYDPTPEWFHPLSIGKEEALEQGYQAISQRVTDAASLWRNPKLGLSGGKDSRAVASALVAQKISFSATVHGLPAHPDVILAKRLADSAGFPLTVDHQGGLPSEDVDTCRRSMMLALIWQAGARNPHKHKTFLANKPYLGAGSVAVSGNSGAVGRAIYLEKLMKGLPIRDLDKQDLDEQLVRVITQEGKALIHPRWLDYVDSSMHQIAAVADRYEIAGNRRLDVFYLLERVRRWEAAAVSSKTGIVFSPFLAPGFLRASLVFSPNERIESPLHRYIIRKNLPHWVSIPFDTEMLNSGLAPVDEADGVTELNVGLPDWVRITGLKGYDNKGYWKTSGRPLITAALKQDGFITEVFDSSLAKERWLLAPDEIVMLHVLEDLL